MITLTWVVCIAVLSSASRSLAPDCLLFDMRISKGYGMISTEQRNLYSSQSRDCWSRVIRLSY